MDYTDIIVLTIIIIIIISIIVLNINSIIDKKLSNVAVNIPPINIPTPQVTVKLQKSCTSDEYTVFLDKDNAGQASQTVSLSPASDVNNEHFGSLNNFINSASQGIDNMVNTVKTDIKNYQTRQQNATLPKIMSEDKKDQQKRLLAEDSLKDISVIPKYNSIDKTTISNISIPNTDQIVQYGNCTIQKHPTSEHVQQQNDEPKCPNRSLDDLNREIYGYMADNSKTVNDYKFPMCSKYEKDIVASNDDDVDITTLFRQNQVFVRAFLEDPVLRAGNLNSYGNYSPIFEIGKISLKKDVINPKPSGFIFENSAVFNR